MFMDSVHLVESGRVNSDRHKLAGVPDTGGQVQRLSKNPRFGDVGACALTGRLNVVLSAQRLARVGRRLKRHRRLLAGHPREHCFPS